VRGGNSNHLQAAATVDSRATSGSGKYKRASDDYDGRQPPHRDSAVSRDSCSLFYGEGQVDRDGYTHIWDRPLPGAPPTSRHVTAAAMMLPVDSNLMYKCRGGVNQGSPPPPPPPLPLPPPFPVVDSTYPSPCQDTGATSSAEITNYYHLDAKDDDQSD